jgi:hypothetical protein
MNKEGIVIEQLLSPNKEEVLKALALVRESENERFIQPLITTWINSEDIDIREQASQMLNTLKVKGFERELMEALRKGIWKSHHGAIMAFLWNSGGNPTSFIFELVKMAVTGGAETMLECFSIIEVMEGPLPEEQLIESQAFLHQAYQDEQHDYNKKLIALLSNALADKEVDVD